MRPLAEFRAALEHQPPESHDPSALAKLFLLSTDFFRNGEDEPRPLRFVTLYGPYASPCYMPW